jgi:hypothetical protein
VHDSYRFKQVEALVLATHGIGQLLPGVNIADDCKRMREQLQKVAKQVRSERVKLMLLNARMRKR